MAIESIQSNDLRTESAGSLYVVATPIGNLSDLSERMMQVLAKVRWVAAEDTRTTRVLLERAGSGATAFAAHRHNEPVAARRVLELLAGGDDVALVSDAGTPAVSDPGARIVDAVHQAGLRVIPIPGPSAALAMVSASGLVEGPFHFEGFLPTRKGDRDRRLSTLAHLRHPFVLFEAPHRIGETLAALEAACGADRQVAIGRELTKRFEEIHRCRATDALAWQQADPNRQRGEYVLVVAGAPASADDASGEAQDDPQAREAAMTLLRALLEELPPGRAVRVAVKATGWPRDRLYAMALEIGGAG